MESLDRVVVVGTGAVGSALRSALATRGVDVRTLSRSDSSAARTAALESCSLLVLCVPDRALLEVATALVGELPHAATPVALHTSGFHGTGPLDPLAARGCAVGSLHPVAAIPPDDPAGGTHLLGALFAFAGDAAAHAAAERLVGAFEGELFELAGGDEAKARYHAACALIANGVVALAEGARLELANAGVAPMASVRCLEELLDRTVANVGRHGSPMGALTGPAARGDAEVVAAHLSLLRDEGLREVYRILARKMVAMSERRGTLEPHLARKVEAALDGA